MYGLVHIAIESLIRQEFGDNAWTRIAAHARQSDKRFLSAETHDDALCFGIVGAASEDLGIPVPKLLESFGEYWIEYTSATDYGLLLDQAGNTFEAMLENLDTLHTRVSNTMPNLEPPSFDFEVTEDGRYLVHYFSHREGLSSMVIGLIRGLAKRFEVDAEIEQLPAGTAGASHEATATFEVRTRRPADLRT